MIMPVESTSAGISQHTFELTSTEEHLSHTTPLIFKLPISCGKLKKPG